MKKWMLLISVLVLMAGSLAFAETDAAYGAWVMEASDITVTVNDETVTLNPTLTLRLGMTEDLSKAYLSAEMRRSDEILAGFWAEEENNGPARYALSTGETCGLIEPGYYLHFIFIANFLDEDTDMSEVTQLPNALNMANAFFGYTEHLGQLPQTLGSVEIAGDGAYRFSAEFEGMAVSATLTLRWEPIADKPFDLSGLREVPFNARKGLFGTEGFTEAEEQMAIALMSDESIARLITVLLPIMNAE